MPQAPGRDQRCAEKAKTQYDGCHAPLQDGLWCANRTSLHAKMKIGSRERGADGSRCAFHTRSTTVAVSNRSSGTTCVGQWPPDHPVVHTDM